MPDGVRSRADVGHAEDYATHVSDHWIWFVTPAWQRPELSEVVFAQRRRLCEQIGADCVVVANDENLELARFYGFATIEQDPHPLGRKYNDGYQYACEQGATHVCPLGSDSWALPDYFRDPPWGKVMAGVWLGMVSEDGKRLASLRVQNGHNPYGTGPFLIPRVLLPRSGRPVWDGAEEGIDRNTLDNIHAETTERYVSRWQEVSFKHRVSLDGYERLRGLAETETEDVWETLGTVYAEDLIGRMRKLYE